MDRYPSGQRGQTVNLLAKAFGGSNPSLSNTREQVTGNRLQKRKTKLYNSGFLFIEA
jgi:hypothetical protein